MATRPADDHRAFEALARNEDVAALLGGPDDVRLLWEVAQVPDFQAVLTDAHTRLLREVFTHLAGPLGRLSEDWVEPQVRRLDRTDGDIHVLLARIAAIRTWTYIAHRGSWLADSGHWQERTRGIEDRLSDTLHERLTAQFVDRRATLIARHDKGALLVEVDENDEVLVQGLLAGRLEGFRFRPEPSLREEVPGLLAAANRGLRAAARERVRACEDAPDSAFSLSPEGRVLWKGAEVGRLGAGDSSISPLLEPLTSELLDPPLREQVRRRLQGFLDAEMRRALGPLLDLRNASLGGVARGVAFALVEGLGSVSRAAVADLVQSLGPDTRRDLSRLGLTLGRHTLYLNALLRPEAMRLRVALAAARFGLPKGPLPDASPSLPAALGSAALLRGVRLRARRPSARARGRARPLRGRRAARQPALDRSGPIPRVRPPWAARPERWPASCAPWATSSAAAASSRRVATIGGAARPDAPDLWAGSTEAGSHPDARRI